VAGRAAGREAAPHEARADASPAMTSGDRDRTQEHGGRARADAHGPEADHAHERATVERHQAQLGQGRDAAPEAVTRPHLAVAPEALVEQPFDGRCVLRPLAHDADHRLAFCRAR